MLSCRGVAPKTGTRTLADGRQRTRFASTAKASGGASFASARHAAHAMRSASHRPDSDAARHRVERRRPRPIEAKAVGSAPAPIALGRRQHDQHALASAQRAVADRHIGNQCAARVLDGGSWRRTSLPNAPRRTSRGARRRAVRIARSCSTPARSSGRPSCGCISRRRTRPHRDVGSVSVMPSATGDRATHPSGDRAVRAASSALGKAGDPRRSRSHHRGRSARHAERGGNDVVGRSRPRRRAHRDATRRHGPAMSSARRAASARPARSPVPAALRPARVARCAAHHRSCARGRDGAGARTEPGARPARPAGEPVGGRAATARRVSRVAIQSRGSRRGAAHRARAVRRIRIGVGGTTAAIGSAGKGSASPGQVRKESQLPVSTRRCFTVD